MSSEAAQAATAGRFVAEGAHVFITGRRLAGLDAAVAKLGRFPRQSVWSDSDKPDRPVDRR